MFGFGMFGFLKHLWLKNTQQRSRFAPGKRWSCDVICVTLTTPKNELELFAMKRFQAPTTSYERDWAVDLA